MAAMLERIPSDWLETSKQRAAAKPCNWLRYQLGAAVAAARPQSATELQALSALEWSGHKQVQRLVMQCEWKAACPCNDCELMQHAQCLGLCLLQMLDGSCCMRRPKLNHHSLG